MTAQDYEAIVRQVYPATSDIVIFGGEDQDPPEYGRVFIALKPKDASYLTSLTKNQIIEELKKYVVASVEPKLIDPSILYVELTSKIYYNRESTDQTPAQIRDKAIGGVQSYLDTSDTEKFNGKFRYSKMVGVIDDADKSINSNLTEVTMRKDFYPSLNSTFYYEVCFQNAFDVNCDDPILSSTGFRVTEYPNFDVYVEDRGGKIVLYRLDSVTGEKVVLDSDIGDIDYVKGELKMYALTIIKGSFFDNRISLRVKPLSNDIKAVREVYLDVDVANSSFTAYKEKRKCLLSRLREFLLSLRRSFPLLLQMNMNCLVSSFRSITKLRKYKVVLWMLLVTSKSMPILIIMRRIFSRSMIV